ncbi:MAG: hypothetical protein IIC01_03510, partial [Planctomycetes bacterium]|nr:hypothetical protein [Planctomycetota bacterium]
MARISSARHSCASTRASSLTLTGIPQRGARHNARTGRIVNLTLTLVALMAAGSAVSTTRGQTIYYTDSAGLHEGVHRVLVSGKNIQNLHDTLGASGIALDADAGKMYWTKASGNNDRIQRANLDGSAVEDLVTTGLFVPVGIAVDPTGGKVYWTDPNPAAFWIRRASLDGSSVEPLITLPDGPHGIDLDTAAGKMYWTTAGGRIQRANLDGSLVQNVLTSLGSGVDIPWGIALDVAGGKIYWTQRGFTVAGQI